MTSFGRSWTLVSCVVLALVLALPVPAAAQQRWYEAYDSALAAVKAGDWATAERNLAVAIERGPAARSQAVVRYGMWRAPFYPEYYLALAYLNQGRAADALNLFRTVQQKQLVPANAPEFKQIAGHITAAEQRIAQLAKKSDPPPVETERKPAVIASNSPANNTANTSASAPNPSGGTKPPDSAAVEQAGRDAKAREARNRWQQLLERGRTELAAGDFASARKTAAEARGLNLEPPRVEELVRDIDTAEARQREGDTRTRLNQLLARGRTELARKQFAAARQSALEAQATGVDAKGGAADLLRQVDIQEGLEALRGAVIAENWSEAQRHADALTRLDSKNAELASLTKRITDGLAHLESGELERAALRAFFGGEYRTALDLTTKLIDRSGGAATARAYFYAACSQAALGLLEGPDGSGRLVDARALFAKVAPRMDQVVADRKFISPRILQALEAAAP